MTRTTKQTRRQATLHAPTCKQLLPNDCPCNGPAPQPATESAFECWTCGDPHRFGTYNDPALSNEALAERHRSRGCDVSPVRREVKP